MISVLCHHSLAVILWILAVGINRGLPVLILKDTEFSQFPTVDIFGMDKDIQTFEGNPIQLNFFHQQIHLEEDFALVAARNFIYNISLSTFLENKKSKWLSSPTDVQSCLSKQKTSEDCQNYVRVILKKPKMNEYLICGTNAFRPLCRTYQFQEDLNSLESRNEEPGTARCPFDPLQNSTSVYIGSRLFSASVADLSGRDALIYSKPLRTEQHDSQWLNEPSFINSFGFGDKAYFFFREMAIENINCGKTIFSRVARVCTDDRGGARILKSTWTSFFKSRLNCSIPGEFPFYFDEIQSTSDLNNGSLFPTLILSDRVPMVYGVFATPKNSLRGSAICAFRFSDIVASFEGNFKEQKTAYSNWLTVRDTDIPDPHPGKVCANDSTTLSDQTLNFIKSHPLMDKAIPAFGGQPIIVQSSLEYSFTQIVIDWQVSAADHRFYDVLFIGTDDGRVLKVINKGHGLKIKTIVIEILNVFEDGAAITGLKIYNVTSRNDRRLMVVSQNLLRSLPLHRCSLHHTCRSCLALKDPYCSWMDNQCINSNAGLQSIETGLHPKCGTESPVVIVPSPNQKGSECPQCSCSQTKSSDLFTTNKIDDSEINRTTSDHVLDSSTRFKTPDMLNSIDQPESSPVFVKAAEPCFGESVYSAKSLTIAIVLSIILSLPTGFLIGYFISYRRQSHMYHLSQQNKSVQNSYDLDPVSKGAKSNAGNSFPMCIQKPCNLFVNKLKDPKVSNSLPNGHAETSFSPNNSPDAVYL